MRAASASERDLEKGSDQNYAIALERCQPEKVMFRTGDLHCLYNITQTIRIAYHLAILENPM